MCVCVRVCVCAYPVVLSWRYEAEQKGMDTEDQDSSEAMSKVEMVGVIDCFYYHFCTCTCFWKRMSIDRLC